MIQKCQGCVELEARVAALEQKYEAIRPATTDELMGTLGVVLRGTWKVALASGVLAVAGVSLVLWMLTW